MLTGRGPITYIEAIGLGFVGVVGVVNKAVDKRGLADAALADEEEFSFVELAFFAAAKFSEVFE